MREAFTLPWSVARRAYSYQVGHLDESGAKRFSSFAMSQSQLQRTTPSSSAWTSRRLAASLSGNDLDSVLSNTDIAVGILLAFLLAALASFLQSRRAQNDFVLGQLLDEPIIQQQQQQEDNNDLSSSSPSSSSLNTTATTTFDDWKEMSQPDNYVWYNTRLRNNNNNNKKQTKESSSSSLDATEQAWVLIVLVVLFAPIFSFEFFLTVSRQIICAVSKDLCLPYHDL